MDEEEIILLNLLSLIEELLNIWQFERSKHWLNRRWLVRPINKKRLTHGHFNTFFQEIKSDPELFFAYTRMDLQTFNFLLYMIEPHIKIFKKRKDVILAEQRIAITLRYLATGDDILSIAFDYRVGFSTVYKIIKETCSVIHEVLAPIYLRSPCKPVWRNIARGFHKDWNMPNCIGAIDGKHVAIKAPAKSGSLYFNYKKFNSIVLLAACNHRYEFTVVDIGAYGESDGGIFARSEFGKAVDEGSLNIPNENQHLPVTDIKMPFFFIGDEAFKMSKNLMRPYPGQHLSNEKRIFNYRLSRARRCIESAFGILVARWRVFIKPIGFEPFAVTKIVLSCVCLHNFLMARTQKSVRQMYCPSEFLRQENNQQHSNEQMEDNQTEGRSRGNVTEAHAMRDVIAKYFLSPEGEVDWQYDYINRGRHQDTARPT